MAMTQNKKGQNETQDNSKFSDSKSSQVGEKSYEQLVEDIKQLALTIDKVEDEKAELDNKFKKALADYMNLEKSIDNRLAIQLSHMKKKVTESLIDIMDSVKLATTSSESLELNEAAKSWVEGVLSTLSKMEKSLLELGIEIIDVKAGDEFDSTLHEALATVPEGEDNKVFEVIQPGYRAGEQVIRPARVIVSKQVV